MFISNDRLLLDIFVSMIRDIHDSVIMRIPLCCHVILSKEFHHRRVFIVSRYEDAKLKS